MKVRTEAQARSLLSVHYPYLYKHHRINDWCVAQTTVNGTRAKPVLMGEDDTFPLNVILWDLVDVHESLETTAPTPLAKQKLTKQQQEYEKQLETIQSEWSPPQPENSGGSCDYYKCHIINPTTAEESYTAECNDIIEALNMTYAEANMFKEIWRSAAGRTLGKLKLGHSEIRGAEKIVFFAERNAIQKGAK